jgi:hypothetical protein
MRPKISRREFIGTAAGIIAGQSLACFLPRPGRKQKKPNLLFIWTDEQRADTMVKVWFSKKPM